MSQDCPSLISDVVFITIICRLTVNEKLGSELIDLDIWCFQMCLTVEVREQWILGSQSQFYPPHTLRKWDSRWKHCFWYSWTASSDGSTNSNTKNWWLLCSYQDTSGWWCDLCLCSMCWNSHARNLFGLFVNCTEWHTRLSSKDKWSGSQSSSVLYEILGETFLCR